MRTQGHGLQIKGARKAQIERCGYGSARGRSRRQNDAERHGGIDKAHAGRAGQRRSVFQTNREGARRSVVAPLGQPLGSSRAKSAGQLLARGGTNQQHYNLQ